MEIQRVSNINEAQFLQYVQKQQPIIITDGTRDWPGAKEWSSEFLKAEFGDAAVQVYDDLFNLVDVCPLSNYLDAYFGPNAAEGAVPYVRWYTKMKDVDFIWADEEFTKISTYWKHPYFMPDSSFLLPYCMPPNSISPTDSRFPAKGLFVSAKGAKTRLHSDPWASDALLIQVTGQKKWTMFSPDQDVFLCDANGVYVDLDDPDLNQFSSFEKARAAFEFTLHPGEAVYIPQGWSHHVNTLVDSVSLTWNFVHVVGGNPFLRYLKSKPTGHDLEVLQYFYAQYLSESASTEDIADFVEKAMVSADPV